jgi:hypothetical protein
MAEKPKKKKEKRHPEADPLEELDVLDERDEEWPSTDARVLAYARLMTVEERLYKLWEERSSGEMDWLGEALGAPVDENVTLWLPAIGDKVAALGGRLELVAVFPNETVTLLVEPGLTAPLDSEDE